MIDTAIVNQTLPAHETVLSTRRMLAFAAGIGDVSPAVFDDSMAGFVAHPAMCVALEWPVLGDPASLALVPDPADRLRAVHLVQDSTFHRPLRANVHVVTSGTVSGVWRGKTGARTACTLRTVDTHGAPFVTSRTVAIYRDVQAHGADRPPPQDESLPEASLCAAGHDIAAEIDIDAALPHRYTECTGIWNPIHTERRVARAAGLPDIVLHGTATWAMAASLIVARFGGGDPTRLWRLRGRFGALVFPGDRLRLEARARQDGGDRHVHFAVLTPTGEAAIAQGYAFLSGLGATA